MSSADSFTGGAHHSGADRARPRRRSHAMVPRCDLSDGTMREWAWDLAEGAVGSPDFAGFGSGRRYDRSPSPGWVIGGGATALASPAPAIGSGGSAHRSRTGQIEALRPLSSCSFTRREAVRSPPLCSFRRFRAVLPLRVARSAGSRRSYRLVVPVSAFLGGRPASNCRARRIGAIAPPRTAGFGDWRRSYHLFRGDLVERGAIEDGWRATLCSARDTSRGGRRRAAMARGASSTCARVASCRPVC